MSEMLVPLPLSIRRKAHHLTHPGLALDKYAETWADHGYAPNQDGQKNQKQILETIKGLSQGKEPQAAWELFYKRQIQVWQQMGCVTFEMRTVSGLSLHLARASALENAGICLHSLYGFPLMPGSGIKGVVRAWATLEGVSQDRLAEVLGTQDQAGAIVFYDAIPSKWPELTIDIVNNHHSDYYSGKDAPGDWENPIPVYFLTLQSGAVFHFSLGKAHTDVPDDLLKEVKGWLTSALTWRGAGAKTNAGYGLFQPLDGEIPAHPQFGKTWSTILTLSSPAFLAGALQDGSDCDLRPATLRGLLRGWWRTLHSGYLNHKQMLQWEEQIFGSSALGGALQIRLRAQERKTPLPYDKQVLVQSYPPTKDNKTTQGLWYHSFGMDEKAQRRYYMPKGASWELSLTATDRNLWIPGLSATVILEQAQAALWLLCHFGAVGAKQRKGWGSLKDLALPDFTLEKVKKIAHQFRQAMGLNLRFRQELAQSPALELMLEPLEIDTTWDNEFWTLHQIGMAAQAFAKTHKHDLAKKALGLPRNIGAPVKGSFRSKKQSINDRGARHTSPTQFHLAQNAQGHYLIRISFFPSPVLPDLPTSHAFLREYRNALKKEISDRLGLKLSGPQHLPRASAHSVTESVCPSQRHGQNRGSAARSVPSRPQTPAPQRASLTPNSHTEYTGVVSKVLYEKNIGWIKNELLSTDDHFFRFNDFQGQANDLYKGMKVRFYLEEGFDRKKNCKTWNAVRIQKISSDR